MVIAILAIVAGFFAIWFGLIGYMPDITDLQNPINKYASIIYSADGKQIGTYNANQQNRIMVNYEDLPKTLVDALVATEDERFYDHSGIDFIALGRAIVKRGILQQSSAGGGSTITQQLAKQLYSSVARNKTERLLQKPIEWVIAIKLERFYTKEEIVAMYLNYFDFLHNAVGIKTAANTYFSKEPSELTLTESAMLVGMCKNPSYFNPVRYPERSKERRDLVLAQMVKNGYLSQSECDTAREKPLALHFHRTDHKDGLAPYFRDFLRRYMMAEKPSRKDYFEWNKKQFIIDSIAWENDPLYGWCNKNTKRDGEHYNIYTDGLRIYTTVDSRMQRYAEEAVYKHLTKDLQPAFNRENRHKPRAPYSRTASKATIRNVIRRTMRQTDRYRSMKNAGATDEEISKAFNTPVEMTLFTYHGDIDTVMTPMDSICYYKRFLRAGFMSMDAHTGAVKAYVGGVNYEHFQYDMVTLGRRQVGSTAKPYLYALALEQGYSPCDRVPCEHRSYGNWSPRGNAHGMVTMKWGLQNSNNLVTAYLMSRLVPGDYRQSSIMYLDMIDKFGINTWGIYPSLPLCLGAYEATVKEMVCAYTAFANRGIRTNAMYVTRIEDSNGEVLANFQPTMEEVISEENAFKMIDMLQAVIEHGTGARIRHRFHMEGDIAGKTGTTNDNSDGWFIGFTPRLVSGAWVGGEDRDIHFDSERLGQGANSALPIWAYFMKKVQADRSLGYSKDEKFGFPEGFNACGRSHSDSISFSGIEDVFE